MNSNFQVMFGGFSLIFFYVAATLGRWNALEQRVCNFIEVFCITLKDKSLEATLNLVSKTAIPKQDF